MDDVTVSITSLARPEELGRTLQSIGPGPKIQVILNGADVMQYRSVISEFSRRATFFMNVDNNGVAASWNQGVVLSGTRFVVLSGDDLRYHDGWMDAVLAAINESESLQWALTDSPLYSSFMVDKHLFPLQGWFDQNFTRVYYEDEDWTLRSRERLSLVGDSTPPEELIPKLGCVERYDHNRAAWNSIPNRVYFWRKWQRLAADSGADDVLFLRPDTPVRRRRPEPAWPSLRAAQAAYEHGCFASMVYDYDQAAFPLRALTKITTNRLVITGRQLVQRRTNPTRELR